MKKLMMLLAMMAMVLVVSVPALAQNGIVFPPIEIGTNDADVDLTDAECVGLIIQQQNQAGLIALQEQDQEAIQRICQEINNTRINDQDTNTVTPSLEFEQDAESGDFDAASELSVTGDNNQLCTPTQQSGNTGNSLNQEGAQPTQGGFDDFEAGNSTLETAADMPTECAQTFGQSAAAS